jgi:hypothetical protein
VRLWRTPSGGASRQRKRRRSVGFRSILLRDDLLLDHSVLPPGCGSVPSLAPRAALAKGKAIDLKFAGPVEQLIISEEEIRDEG